MSQRGGIVLVDTNIILECFRARCWNAVSKYYCLETVEECYQEALTGNPHRPGHVTVDPEALRKGLNNIHRIPEIDRVRLALALPTSDALDAGERDLFAYALSAPGSWMASSADRAALNAAFALGWMERMVSLAEMASNAGARPALKLQFSASWLSEVRTAYHLGLPLRRNGI